MQDDIKRRASDAVNHLHEALNVLGCKAQELGLKTGTGLRPLGRVEDDSAAGALTERGEVLPAHDIEG